MNRLRSLSRGTIAWWARSLVPGALAIFLLQGCADWFQSDTCGGPYLRVDVNPTSTCLVLAGEYHASGSISGKNNCQETLVVTPDGAAPMSFPPGAAISIDPRSLPSSKDAGAGTWVLPASLGTQDLTITVTKTAC